MDQYWWDYTFDPGTRYVKVRRWAKRGTLFAVVEAEFDGLTWHEAQDVFDMDSTWLIEQALADRL